MASITKDQLLGATASTMPTETVRVPELGGTLTVRGLTAAERDRILKDTATGKGRKQKTDIARLRTLLVARTVIGDDGQRMFTDGEAHELGKVRSDVVERVFSVAAKLSGLLDADDDDADESDEDAAAKKSEAASGTVPSGSSTTD